MTHPLLKSILILVVCHLFEIKLFLDGGSNENCGIAYPQLESWTDWICKITREVPLHCSCEKKGEVYLTMRGLCSNSNIDKYWTAQVKFGRFYLLGILSSQIDYDFQNKKWNMKVEKLIEGVSTYYKKTYTILQSQYELYFLDAIASLELGCESNYLSKGH